MDIDGLGDAIVDQLLKNQRIQTVTDLYKLTHEDLITLERFGEKSTKNLLTAIQASKKKPFSNVLFAIGIPFIGKVSADIISAHYPTFEHLKNATVNELITIDQIGQKIANSLIDTLNSNSYQQIIHELMHFITPPTIINDQPFSGYSFLITGTLSQPRNNIETKIKNKGGKIIGSVSKKLNYLVLGESPGSKYKKAKELNSKGGSIHIISEEELNSLIN